MNNLNQTATAIASNQSQSNNKDQDNYSTGSMPMPFPSFAKCCSSNNNKEQVDVELLLDNDTDYDKDRRQQEQEQEQQQQQQQQTQKQHSHNLPMKTVVLSALSCHHDTALDENGFPFPTSLINNTSNNSNINTSNNDYKDDDDDDQASIDFATDFRTITSPPSAPPSDRCKTPKMGNTKGEEVLPSLVEEKYPPPSSSSSSSALSGRRLHSRKRLTPSPFREDDLFGNGDDDNDTYDNVSPTDDNDDTNVFVIPDEPANTEVVTAIKERPNSKVGLVFSRERDLSSRFIESPLPSTTTSTTTSSSNVTPPKNESEDVVVPTMITHVLPNSIFSSLNNSDVDANVEVEVEDDANVNVDVDGGNSNNIATSDDLVGATLYAVNGEPVRNPRHAAQLVYRVEREVRLTVVKKNKVGGTGTGTGTDVANEISNSKGATAEIDIQLQKLKNATSNTHTPQEEVATLSTSSSSSEDLNSDDNEDDQSLTLIQEVPMNFTFDDTNDDDDDAGAMENGGRSSSRIPLLRHMKAKKKKKKMQQKKKKEKMIKDRGGGNGKDAKYIRVPSSSSTKDAKSDDEDNEDKKEDVPVGEEEEPKKDNTIESDKKPSQVMSTTKKLEKDDDEDIICEEEDEANQNKNKSTNKNKMSFKRAFGMKKNKIGSGTIVDDKGANGKAIEPTVSADEILNDLNSVHSSNNSKGSKRGEEEEDGKSNLARVSREVTNPESEETILFLTSAPKDGWSEGRKQSPASIPKEVPAVVTTMTTTNKAEDVPENSKFTTLSMATERATSFIVESIVGNFSGGGYDSMNNVEEAVFVFPAGGSKGSDDEEEEETTSRAEEGKPRQTTGVPSEDDTNKLVEDMLSVKTHLTPGKKKGLLKMFKKKAKKTQGVDYIVVDDDDDAAKEETMVRDDKNAARKEESISDEDEVVIEGQGDVDGPFEDDNARNIDLDSAQDGFFKRSMFKNKSKRSSVKTRPVLEDALPLMGDYVAVDEEDDCQEQENICDEDEAVVQNQNKVSVDGRDDTNDIDINVSRGSFFKRAFKKKLTPAKKQSDTEDIVPGPEHSRSVTDKDDDTEVDVSGVERQDEFREISLNVTLTGDVELHAESDTSFFDCDLSPISSPMGQSDDKPILSVGEVGFTSVGSDSDATENCPITDHSTTLHNTAFITPDAHPTSGHSSVLPLTPPTPKKIEENWGMGLFENEVSPSPSASIVGPGRDDCNEMRIPAMAVSGLKSFECRLKQGHASAGSNGSVSISMEVPEAEGSSQMRISEPMTTPPINRKLSFQSTYSSNDSACKAQPQTREAVDVATVCKKGGGFSFEDKNRTVDEIQSLARTKQHAFDIIKQSKSSVSRARNCITPEQMRISSLKKNLFSTNNTMAVGDHPIGYDEMQDGKNDTTLETVDMTGEELMLEL